LSSGMDIAALASMASSSLALYINFSGTDCLSHLGTEGPAEWCSRLAELARSLAVCSSNDGHQYYRGLQKCPWCSIEIAGGLILFFGRISGQGATWSLNIGYFASAMANLPELAVEHLPLASMQSTGRAIPPDVELAVGRTIRRRIWWILVAMVVSS